jgi:hypothetical protein
MVVVMAVAVAGAPETLVVIVVVVVVVVGTTVIVALVGAILIVSRGLRARCSGWLICLSGHVVFPSPVQARFGGR